MGSSSGVSCRFRAAVAGRDVEAHKLGLVDPTFWLCPSPSWPWSTARLYSNPNLWCPILFSSFLPSYELQGLSRVSIGKLPLKVSSPRRLHTQSWFPYRHTRDFRWELLWNQKFWSIESDSPGGPLRAGWVNYDSSEEVRRAIIDFIANTSIFSSLALSPNGSFQQDHHAHLETSCLNFTLICVHYMPLGQTRWFSQRGDARARIATTQVLELEKTLMI